MPESPEAAPIAAGNVPGDPSPEETIARILRVDHAGEYGAVRIYAGQLAVLGTSAVGGTIEKMAACEQEHLKAFSQMLAERRVRPTVLSPIWHVAGYALGVATALMGPKAAMACTAAVEEVIDEHYAGQAAALGDTEPALRERIESFRADEIAHRDEALAQGAEQAPAYFLLAGAIKAGSRLAIWLSTRL